MNKPGTRTNPATGRALEAAPEPDLSKALAKLSVARLRFLEWRNTTVEERAVILGRTAMLLREKQHEYARLMTEEMGKPIRQGLSEIEKCALTCDYYAENAKRFLEPDEVKTEATRSYVSYEPLGVILAVMPWNFPFWQVLRFFAPTVMAGNTALLKHASNVPGCAKAIEALVVESGFPEGVLDVVFLDNEQTGRLVEEPLVAAVTLTGSEAAGRSVAAHAGRALKKCVLELGGSDAYVVLEDADVEQAAATCVQSRLINSGQSCIAAKRFIVVQSRRKEFQDRVVQLMKDARFGDPMDVETEVGPMARVELRDQLHDQVTRSVSEGATLLLGGTIPEGPGAWYPPTVLSDVRPEMSASKEELFGPVAVILSARDNVHAIQLANQSDYGLGAAVFTQDVTEGERIARRELEAGACFVNTHVRSDPHLPFGGIKNSGFGRELGRHGMLEFVNVKTVYVA